MWKILVVAAVLAYANAEENRLVQQKGDSLTLNCSVASGIISWTVNGKVYNDTSSSGQGAAQTSTLKKANLSVEDAGEYKCMKGSSDQPGEVINIFHTVIISISGESKVLDNSTHIQLGCTVDNPEIQVDKIVWYRNDEMLVDSEKYQVSNQTDHTKSVNITSPDMSDIGAYRCVVTVKNSTKTFEQEFSVDTAPVVKEFENLRNRVEGEKGKIDCNVTGYPIPEIKWYRQLEDSDEVVELSYDAHVNATTNKDGVPHGTLIIDDLKIKTDRGKYTCVATNYLGTSNSTVELRVKDKLAAVWPFLGIVAEVAILCSIIFIFEKRRNKRMEEEEEVDQVKQDMMNQSNGNGEELRQRPNATKS